MCTSHPTVRFSNSQVQLARLELGLTPISHRHRTTTSKSLNGSTSSLEADI